VAVVPPAHDPDSFIKANGGEAFRQLIAGAEGFFDYYLNRLCQQNDIATDKGRITVLREMAEAARKTGNTVLIDKYAQKTALRLGVSPDAVRTEFKKVAPAWSAPDEEESFETASEFVEEMTRPSVPELWLLKLVLMNPPSVGWLVAHLDPNWVQHPVVKDIVQRRLRAETDGSWRSVGLFLDQFESPQVRSLITEATMDDREIPNPEQQLADLTLRLRNQFLDRQLAALTLRISQPDASEVEKLELLRQQQQLKQLKRQPLSPLS